MIPIHDDIDNDDIFRGGGLDRPSHQHRLTALEMTSGNSGAVFFLGTRAHYQVLDQPESRFDSENGNTSTETIYQNPSSQELWSKPQTSYDDVDRRNWNCEGDVTVTYEKEKQEIGVGVKRRTKRRQSEAALCEELRPAALNCLADNEPPKPKPRRVSLLGFLSSLARRKRRLESDQVQYLRHLESALTNCTYRESCRCLDCQVR
ncbi:hypothetical protein RR46_12684 [Papilio xuthus]|uniref:DUF4802 domain-containing protein n=1 Tax=Papilio xuthus TaxID=66420 RepID=A0A194PV71_PAPXU|nr:hypothetical protein RR46_12684 [Papilio xuthus]